MCFSWSYCRKIKNALVGLFVYNLFWHQHFEHFEHFEASLPPTHNHYELQGSCEKGWVVIVGLYSLLKLNQNWQWQWDLSNIWQIITIWRPTRHVYNVPQYMFSFFCFVKFEKSSQHLYKVAKEKTISKLFRNSKVVNVLIEDICLSDTLMYIFIFIIKTLWINHYSW